MAILRDLSKPTYEQLLAQLATTQAENDRLKVSKAKSLSLKVSDKGGVSVYGLGRYPVSLYLGQWERLLAAVPEITAFIDANRSKLSVKAEG